MACYTPTVVDGELGPSHFALISIDIEGSIHLRCSRSIAKTFQGSLSVQLADNFLKAVVMSGETCSPIDQARYGVPGLPHQITPATRKTSPSPRITHVAPRKTASDGKEHTLRFPPANLFPPTVESASPRWDTQSRECTRRNVWSVENKMWRPEVIMSIINRDLVRKYYEKAFRNLQQANCRALAKAYVKLVEPRKQIKFPYNGRTVVGGVHQQLDPEVAKPPWWPPGVRHREPDHLLKEERIGLLIHILCELRTSHGITTKKLRETDQQIRRYISPADKVCILDEIYRVRQEEIDLLEGRSDGQRQVWISRMNLPEATGATFNHNEHNGKSIPSDAASTNISDSRSAFAKSCFTNNAPPALFEPVTNFSAYSPLDHPYDVQGHFPGKYYAGPDPKTISGFEMTVPVSMPPQGLKRKRENEEIAHIDAITPDISTHDFSPSVTGDLQPYPGEYPGVSYNFLQQGFVSPGLLSDFLVSVT